MGNAIRPVPRLFPVQVTIYPEGQSFHIGMDAVYGYSMTLTNPRDVLSVFPRPKSQVGIAIASTVYEEDVLYSPILRVLDEPIAGRSLIGRHVRVVDRIVRAGRGLGDGVLRVAQRVWRRWHGVSQATYGICETGFA